MIKQTVSYGVWTLNRHDDNKIEVLKNGQLCEKSTPALREIATELGYEIDPEWRTSQLGRNVLKAMQNAGESKLQINAEETPKNEEPIVSARVIDPVHYTIPDREYFEIQDQIRENIDRQQVISELEKDYENGDVRATMILAKLYGTGPIARLMPGENEEEEWKYWMKLAERDNIYAMRMLKEGFCRGSKKYLERNIVLSIICDICTDFLNYRHDNPDTSIWHTIKKIAWWNSDEERNQDKYLRKLLYTIVSEEKATTEELKELKEKYKKLENDYDIKSKARDRWYKYYEEEKKLKEEAQNEITRLKVEIAQLKKQLSSSSSSSKSSSRSSGDERVSVRIKYSTDSTMWRLLQGNGQIVTMTKAEYKKLLGDSLKARTAFVRAKFNIPDGIKITGVDISLM